MMRPDNDSHRWRTLIAVATALLLAAAGISGLALTSAAANARSAAASAGCGKPPALSSGPHSIQSGGRTRNYILRLPANYDNNRPYRMVFGFHWNGGTAGDVDSGGTSGYSWSYFGLRAMSNDGAIFVAPQGLGNGWANTNNADLTFVDDMIRQLDAGLCVDTEQRFAGGFSYGGGMSFALACDRPTVFRAVAVYSGGQISGCGGGTQPIAYIGLHGLRDPVAPIASGRSARDRFVRNNGCTPQNPPEPARGSLTHVVTTYSGCRAGYPVAWAAFDAGHTPNPVDGSPGDYEPGEKSWTRVVVWNFFTHLDGSSPGPTPGPTPDPAPFRLRNEGSGRCLDVNGGSAANGTPMVVWDCHGNANQQLTRNGAALQVLGKCLNVPPGATAGTRVQLQDCNGDTNQQWALNSDSTIRNAQSGLCLDVNGASTANGTAVIVWNCHDGANQRWTRA